MKDASMHFCKIGDVVRAKVRIYDTPGMPDPGPVRAEPGETGVCIDLQSGCCPTIDFGQRGITDVFEEEVEVI